MTGGKRRQRGSGSAGSDGERGVSPLEGGASPLPGALRATAQSVLCRGRCARYRRSLVGGRGGGMSLPHTMRASLEVRPARVLALGKVLRGEGKGLCVCAYHA